MRRVAALLSVTVLCACPAESDDDEPQDMGSGSIDQFIIAPDAPPARMWTTIRVDDDTPVGQGLPLDHVEVCNPVGMGCVALVLQASTDDALDYTADSKELGKNVGDDLAEGKPTLPLIYAMANGDAIQRELIRDAIEQGSADRFDEINQAILQTGALGYTIERAQKHAVNAQQAIAGLDASDFKQALMFIADYAVERSY